MAKDTVKFFCSCAGHLAQLHFRGWLSLDRDFERIFGRQVLMGERFVRDGRMIAFGACDICGKLHPAERLIRFSNKPSRHLCNSLCMGARGPNCECSCGGKNHGAGFIESPLLFGDAA